MKRFILACSIAALLVVPMDFKGVGDVEAASWACDLIPMNPNSPFYAAVMALCMVSMQTWEDPWDWNDGGTGGGGEW